MSETTKTTLKDGVKELKPVDEPKTFEERLKQDMKKEQVDSWGMIEKKFKNSK
jgi:hypothetical protein